MNNQILNFLKSIPFMDLKINFEFQEIKKEVLTNEVWHDYYPPNMEITKALSELHTSYRQCALTTIHKHGNSSIVREQFRRWKDKDKKETENYYVWPLEDQKWYPTEQVSNFPLLFDLIRSLTDKPILSKIVKSGPGHSLGWHSHQNDDLLNFRSPEQCILHIPIVTNIDVVHIVTSKILEDRREFKEKRFYELDNNYYIKNLSASKIWFFNSYHQHTYKNFSDEERVDVLIFSDVRDNPTLEKNIAKSISLYEGPYIQ